MELVVVSKTRLFEQSSSGVPITPNQEGTVEMRDEVLTNVGVQDLDTSGYQVSDLNDVEFYWENDQLDVDSVFRPGIDTPFSPSTFKDFELGSMAENPILIDEEKDKNSSALHPTTPVSERPTRLLLLRRSRPFGTRIENVADYVYRNLFEYFTLLLLCMYFIINYL